MHNIHIQMPPRANVVYRLNTDEKEIQGGAADATLHSGEDGVGKREAAPSEGFFREPSRCLTSISRKVS